MGCSVGRCFSEMRVTPGSRLTPLGYIFCRPPAITPVESHLYKKHGGRGIQKERQLAARLALLTVLHGTGVQKKGNEKGEQALAS